MGVPLNSHDGAFLPLINRTKTVTMHSAISTVRVGKSAERRHPRFAVEFPVRILNHAAARERSAHDLSEGGIALVGPVEIAEGEQILLQFTPPHSEWQYTVQAKVKHVSSERCGLEFHRLTRRESDELGRICRLLSVSA